MDQAAQQPTRVSFHYFLLPRLQLDYAEMLRARRMLGKDTGPVFPMTDDFDAAEAMNESNSDAWRGLHDSHRMRRFVDDVDVVHVQSDTYAIHGARH